MLKLLFSSLILILLLMASLVACGNGEKIINTIIQTAITTETHDQTVTQIERLTETQNLTITQTATQIQKQTDTATITVYPSNPQTTTIPATTSPAIATSTVTIPSTTTFTVSYLNIKPRVPTTGVFIVFSVTVTNTGSSEGVYDAILYINRIQIEDSNNVSIESTQTITKSVNVAAGESKIVTFNPIMLQDGRYTLAIDDLEDYLEAGS